MTEQIKWFAVSPLNEAFGPACENSVQVIDELEKYITNNKPIKLTVDEWNELWNLGWRAARFKLTEVTK